MPRRLVIWEDSLTWVKFRQPDGYNVSITLQLKTRGVNAMVCAKCQSPRMHRIRREGFLRVALAPLFGFYPWRCSVCRTEKLIRTRGIRKRHESSDSHGTASSHSAEQLHREPLS